MGRKQRAGGRYVTPIDVADGSEATAAGPHGRYTLTAGHTYVYVLGGLDAPIHSFHLTGYTAAAILTSATPQDCNHHELDVTDIADAAATKVGQWITENPTTAYVGTNGAGWVATQSVLAVAGGAVGGAMWHLADDGANRHRILVVVGGTGGDFTGAAWGKE